MLLFWKSFYRAAPHVFWHNGHPSGRLCQPATEPGMGSLGGGGSGRQAPGSRVETGSGFMHLHCRHGKGTMFTAGTVAHVYTSVAGLGLWLRPGVQGRLQVPATKYIEQRQTRRTNHELFYVRVPMSSSCVRPAGRPSSAFRFPAYRWLGFPVTSYYD